MKCAVRWQTLPSGGGSLLPGGKDEASSRFGHPCRTIGLLRLSPPADSGFSSLPLFSFLPQDRRQPGPLLSRPHVRLRGRVQRPFLHSLPAWRPAPPARPRTGLHINAVRPATITADVPRAPFVALFRARGTGKPAADSPNPPVLVSHSGMGMASALDSSIPPLEAAKTGLV